MPTYFCVNSMRTMMWIWAVSGRTEALTLLNFIKLIQIEEQFALRNRNAHVGNHQ